MRPSLLDAMLTLDKMVLWRSRAAQLLYANVLDAGYIPEKRVSSCVTDVQQYLSRSSPIFGLLIP